MATTLKREKVSDPIERGSYQTRGQIALTKRDEPGSPAPMYLMTIDANMRRRGDSNANPFALHRRHGDPNVAIDHDLFPDMSGQN